VGVGVLERLRARLARGEALVAGVLSGTSGDGIDVALARLPPIGVDAPQARHAPELVAFETLPFPPLVAARVRAALDGEPFGLRETALLSRDLGRAFGEALRKVASLRGLQPDLAGSHGQTVYHHDGCEPSGPATLQLGDGDFVAEAAGCTVVSDFRQRDLAAGGEGAPISALADDVVFAALPRPALILNLGGMANLTWLPAPGADLMSFDTGPCNALLDGLARRLLGRPYDTGGEQALAGTPRRELIESWLAHPFLAKRPPKSTGRDTFGERWVDAQIAAARALGVLRRDDQPQDLLASAAEFVARSVVQAAREFVPQGSQWLVVCGGGAHHARLLAALAALSPWPVAAGDDFGVHPDAREALVFAVLAARCVSEVPLTSPSATGARVGRTLGKISLAPLGDERGAL
jgi:anhydro-N-acetylmuramic acid kinase